MADEQEAARFAVAMLRRACYVKCNPSSLYQRLVFGSERNSTHETEMKASKKNCLAGCDFAAMSFPADAAEQLSLPLKDGGAGSRKDHEGVLDGDDKRDAIVRSIKFCDNSKEMCADKCEAMCQKFPGVAKSFQGYTAATCIRDCTTGCMTYVNNLEDNF
jgi:hypothetical protein